MLILHIGFVFKFSKIQPQKDDNSPDEPRETLPHNAKHGFMPNGWFHPIDDQPLECNLFDRQLLLSPNESTMFFDTEFLTEKTSTNFRCSITP